MSDHAHNPAHTKPLKVAAQDCSRPSPNQSVQLPNKIQAKPCGSSNIPKINRYKIATLIPTQFARALRCNVLLHAIPSFPSHSPLACPEPTRGGTRHCRFDRYTCRTKNAVSSSTSSKLPNLIDTLSHPTRMRILPALSEVEGRANIASRRLSPSALPCNCRSDEDRHPERSIAKRRNSSLIAHRPPKSLDTLAPQPLQISRHLCRDIFRVNPIPSTKLPKYRGTFLPIRPGSASRAEHREARDVLRRNGGLSTNPITTRNEAKAAGLKHGATFKPIPDRRNQSGRPRE